MPLRVAVLSDAVSRDFIFPIWYRYYGNQFGHENLFLLTYSGLSSEFQEFKLGGLIELPLGYEDSLRQKVISRLVAVLLPTYDVIVRVDIDEFLVVDPRIASSLYEFVSKMPDAYMTARGFDVIQIAGEPPLLADLGGSLLKNRNFAYPNSALNKTCIVKHSVEWSSGFHWANVYPNFGAVFMLHMKRVDVEWQLDWYRNMYNVVKENPIVAQSIKEYYFPDRNKIERYHGDVSNRRRLYGVQHWYRDEFMLDFHKKLRYVAKDGLYFGEYGHELVLCEILPEWKAMI